MRKMYKKAEYELNEIKMEKQEALTETLKLKNIIRER